MNHDKKLRALKKTIDGLQSALYEFRKELDAALDEAIESGDTFRIQESMRNYDGSFDPPHWNEVVKFKGQTAIPVEELRDHLQQIGEWTIMFTSTDGDARPGYRRIVDVTWQEDK
jgi:hypothetical protein